MAPETDAGSLNGDRRAELERYGRTYAEHALAVIWTDSLEGLAAKRVSVGAWETTQPDTRPDFAAGVFAQRGQRKNPAITARTSGLILLDVDTAEGLAELEALALPPTWTVQSSAPPKRHLWFRVPARVEQLPLVGFRFEEDGFHGDSNRYLVAPPAIHPDTGEPYRFLPGLGPGELELAELPADVYAQFVARAGHTQKQARVELEDPARKIRQGGRSDAVFRFACLQRRWGLSAEAIEEGAQRFNLERCEPPLAPEAVRHQVQGAFAYPGGEELAREKVGAGAELAWLDNFEAREARYVDRPMLQEATLHLLCGRPGIGKGAICAAWVASCTSGEMYGAPRVALWLASEDDPSIDLSPRVQVAGGNRSLVALIPTSFRLPEGIPWLHRTIAELGDVGLVVIDPLANHVGGANTDREAEVRTALMPLGVAAGELELPIVGVRHLSTKEARGDALGRILGSTAWVGVPRVVLVAAVDREERELVHVHARKGNRVPPSEAGRCYRLVGRPFEGFDETVVAAINEGTSDADVDALLAGEASGGKTRSAAAREAILATLRGVGEMESDELDAVVAAEAGVSAKTVRNLRSELRAAGLIRAIPVKDEAGAVVRWRAAITYAGLAAEAADDPPPEPPPAELSSETPPLPRARARGGTEKSGSGLFKPYPDPDPDSALPRARAREADSEQTLEEALEDPLFIRGLLEDGIVSRVIEHEQPGVVRCEICRHPGELYCSDTVGCNYRARRRLRLPAHVADEWARWELLGGERPSGERS